MVSFGHRLVRVKGTLRAFKDGAWATLGICETLIIEAHGRLLCRRLLPRFQHEKVPLAQLNEKPTIQVRLRRSGQRQAEYSLAGSCTALKAVYRPGSLDLALQVVIREIDDIHIATYCRIPRVLVELKPSQECKLLGAILGLPSWNALKSEAACLVQAQVSVDFSTSKNTICFRGCPYSCINTMNDPDCL